MGRLVGAFAGSTYHIVGNLTYWLKLVYCSILFNPILANQIVLYSDLKQSSSMIISIENSASKKPADQDLHNFTEVYIFLNNDFKVFCIQIWFEQFQYSKSQAKFFVLCPFRGWRGQVKFSCILLSLVLGQVSNYVISITLSTLFVKDGWMDG